jgi:hypothetical protein
MSKELEVDAGENLFGLNHGEFSARGLSACDQVLGSLGGYSTLADRFPIDRGDANRALVMLCLKLASAVEKTHSDLAERFHGAAIQLGSAVSEAGSPQRDAALLNVKELVTTLRSVVREVDSQALGLDLDPLTSGIAKSLRRFRILFVHANPDGSPPLRVASELRAIRQSCQLAGRTADVDIEDLPAATFDDLRRKLLLNEYDVVHFAGHADDNIIVFEGEGGSPLEVKTEILAKLFDQHPATKRLVLNACNSVKNLTRSIAPITVGMTDEIDDKVAIEFAKGFYDTVLHGKTIQFAVEQGKLAAQSNTGSLPPIKVLER